MFFRNFAPAKQNRDKKTMKKLFIETYGCQMNVADSEVVASVMRMAGYEPTENMDEADAVMEMEPEDIRLEDTVTVTWQIL